MRESTGGRPVPPMSPTLELNERVRKLQATGVEVAHFGFGEAGLPVAEVLRNALCESAQETAYGPVAGSSALRDGIAAHFARRGLPTDPSQVMVGPGSKSLLFGVMRAIDGDVVVPRPSWVSYIPQVRLLGRQPIAVPIPLAAGGIPDPDLLPEALSTARRRGLNPKVLIVTTPDNPTGTLASRTLLEQVAAIARKHDVWILSDEIYRDLTHNPSEFVSAASVSPDNVIITTGLSKSLALGGWRIGAMRVPSTPAGLEILRDTSAVASEIWSSISAPVDAAAQVGFADGAEISDYISAARRLHAKVSSATYEVFSDLGIACRQPRAGFYMYPDLEAAAPFLTAHGVVDDTSLADYLLSRHHVAVLQGSAFGDDPHKLRFRVATSLLYGETKAQRLDALALATSDASQLPPHISASIEKLRTAMSHVMASI